MQSTTVAAVRAKKKKNINSEPQSLLCPPLRKYGSGVMEEDALQSNPVDKVKFGGGDHPVEVVGGRADRILGFLEDLKEENYGEAR